MKTYDFAPIAAREYPTVKILDHPYIWGGVEFCLNVSEKAYAKDLDVAMKEHGIQWLHCPVSEDEGADWLDSLKRGLVALRDAHMAGKKMVVHCDGGNNRSRSFVEAFYLMLTGGNYHDEYRGEYNHLIYNCKIGHLPPLEELEQSIRKLITIG
jgi:hypothetical protein